MSDLSPAERDAEIVRLKRAGKTRSEIRSILSVTKAMVDNALRSPAHLAALPVPLSGELMPTPTTREGFAEAIAASWRESAEAIFRAGRLLAEAKAALPHGDFQAMIDADLPFGRRTAQMLMAIAADERLTNANHGSHLPPSWRTLYEIHKLDDDALEAKIADGTINPGMERRDIATTVKQQGRATKEFLLAKKIEALPERKYGVIVADPEWRFEPYSRATGMDRAADNHYPTSATDEIAARPVGTIAADDCVLFLWATAPMLKAALTVMERWGFDYRSHFIWAKDRSGTGYWNRNRHELLLVGVKGNPPAPAPGTQSDSLLDAPVGEHSAKPEKFLEMIEGYFPTLPKIELNRRGPARPGWDAWGNEVEHESRAKAEEAVRPDTAQAKGMLPRGEEGEALPDLADDAASRPAEGRTSAATEDTDRDSRERPAPDAVALSDEPLPAADDERLVTATAGDSSPAPSPAEISMLTGSMRSDDEALVIPDFLKRDKDNRAPFMREAS